MSTDVITSRAMVWAAKVQSIADQARDLTLDAAQSVGARYADESRAVDLQKLLDGRSDREKIDGMRRVVAISSKGIDMSGHFASVVKNVASSNLELRKLVYIYIARYAETQPDLALLSINTIQKALTDQNQVVRAHALRVISSIRVTSISGIVLLSIKKCINDSSEYVRKTAAMAILKTHSLDSGLHTQLKECLRALLADDSPAVVAAAVETYESICFDEVELIHPNFRRICRMIGQMDSFAQVAVIRVLQRYARICFLDPNRTVADCSQDFYDTDAPSSAKDKDLSLFLKSLDPLLMSLNSATIISASQAIYRTGAIEDAQRTILPMISLLRSSSDVQYVVLTNIVVSALSNPDLWSPKARYFLIHPSDPAYIWELKLELMTLIIDRENAGFLLSELIQYSSDATNELLARAAIQAISKCAQRNSEIADACMEALFEHVRSESTNMTGDAVVAVRQLIQLNPINHLDHIKLLARSLNEIQAAAARASIFWLVCENLDYLFSIAPDVLRVGLRNFANEAEDVRIQILALAVKLYVQHSQHSNQEDVAEVNTVLQEMDKVQIASEANNVNGDDHRNGDVKHDIKSSSPLAEALPLPDIDSPIPKMYAYICQLARYDPSYDIRDRLRTYKILVSSPNWPMTQRLLFCRKPLPVSVSASTGKVHYATGSSSMLIGLRLPGYSDLPQWTTSSLGVKERDVETKVPVQKNIHNQSMPSSRTSSTHEMSTTTVVPPKAKSALTGLTSLDDFYATSSSGTATSDEDDQSTEEEQEQSEEEISASDEAEETESDEEEDEEDETEADARRRLMEGR